jgi:hypothetical protein
MPSAEIISEVIEEISKGSRQLAYFFDHLSSPVWIAPLAAAGVFSRPYGAEEQDGYLRFPVWPPSQYLARMAGEAPEEVFAVLRDLPDSDNERVREDLTAAALALPLEMSAEIATRQARWVSEREHLYFAEVGLSSLVVRLADEGRLDAALELAAPLLELRPDWEGASEDSFAGRPRPQAKFADWQFGRLAAEIIAALFRADRTRGATFAFDLVEQSVRLSSRTAEDGQLVDFSYIWRSAIEDHEQNTHRGIEDTVISVVRNQLEFEMDRAPDGLPDAVGLLAVRDLQIFERLALHIVRRFAPAGSTLIRDYVLNGELLNSVGVWHEYALLLAQRFGDLEAPDRAAFMSLISAGPSRESLEEHADPDEWERYASIWRLRRLALIKEHLTGTDLDDFVVLTERFGTPDHPEFVSYGRSFVGPTSPLTDQDLRAMSLEAVVSYLETWEPDQGWGKPSPEGLARALTTVVSHESHTYSSGATQFIGLDPTYVRGLLSGLETAVRNKSSLEWAPVVELSEWIVAQPREIAGRVGEYADLDPGWVWARKEVAALCSLGFESDNSEPPIELAPRIWSILSALSSDPEPTPEYEAQYGGDNMDPTMLSLNTVRGQAMHATVRFGLWMKRAIDGAGEETETGKSCVLLLDQVKGVLERHLDYEADPSLAVRAVYGQWFPWLTLLGRDWAIGIAPAVFPKDEGSEAYWHAAWDAYVTWTQPYNEMLALLGEEYRLAILRASDEARQRLGATSSPSERLAEHIVVFYWRGLIELGGEGSLLRQLFESGSEELRSHAIGFVGRALANEPTADSLPDEVRERLEALWAWRVEQVGAESGEERGLKELNAFGWWASSHAFADDWVLDQLEAVMRLGSHPEPDFAVLERLAKAAAALPRRTVTVLTEYLQRPAEPWSVLGHRDAIGSILEAAIRSKDKAAVAEAVNLLEWLGTQGFQEFRPTYDRAAAVLAGL